MENNQNLNVLVNSENKLKVYRNADRILILFILNMEDGCFKVCSGVGDKNLLPIGRYSWELYTVKSRTEAEEILRMLDTMFEFVLEPDDGNYNVRGNFDPLP